MKDFNILSYVGRSLWAITDQKWAEMLPALVRHAKGVKLSAEELAAFAGNGDRPEATKRGVIAVIPVSGVIAHRMNALEESSGGTSCEGLGRMIDTVAADAGIGTIVYRFNTPGGTVPGVMELAAKMFALRGQKTQIAVVDDLCASAGYWLASQCDEIVCIPSGMAGSIGVFSAHQDLSKLLEQEGVKVTLIKAGKFKTEGNPFEPLTDEAKAVMQARVDEAYAQFVKDVARGRGVSVADVRGGYGEGRALTAKDAKAAGLVDRIATFDDTLARLSGRRAAASGARAADEQPAIAAEDPAMTLAVEEAVRQVDPDAAIRERLERI